MDCACCTSQQVYSSLPGGSPRLHDILQVASSPPCLQLVPAFACFRLRRICSLIRDGLMEIVDILDRLGDVQRIADGAMRSAEKFWQHALKAFSGFVNFRGKMLELLGFINCIKLNFGVTFDGLSSFSSQHCISTLQILRFPRLFLQSHHCVRTRWDTLCVSLQHLILLEVLCSSRLTRM
jgi:hypothetical protein